MYVYKVSIQYIHIHVRIQGVYTVHTHTCIYVHICKVDTYCVLYVFLCYHITVSAYMGYIGEIYNLCDPSLNQR